MPDFDDDDLDPIPEPTPAKTSVVHLIIGQKNWKRIDHLTEAWKCTPKEAVERALEEAVLRQLD